MKEKNFEPLKDFLGSMDLEYDITELHEANIGVSEKDGFYIYNYNNNVLVPRDDPIIMFCRGLVLREGGEVMNLPFTRFFNYHEAECIDVDIESADVLEKLDGSLISVWHTGEDWEVTTRGSFYPNEYSHNFKETFCRLFDNFYKLIPSYCYMFELISKENRIVTKYEYEKVVLLGARCLETLKEFGQNHLDIIAETLNVSRPIRFNANDIDGCRELFEDLADDEEGLVVVDKNFNRFKLKQESYLKMSKIKSLKPQEILEYVTGKLTMDEDFTDMEEVKKRIDEVRAMYNEVKRYSLEVYKTLSKHSDQKTFAMYALKYSIANILFALKKGRKFEEVEIRCDKLLIYYDSIVKPIDGKVVILRGLPGSGKSTWVRENGLDLYSVSMDELRIIFESPRNGISQDHNNRVYKLFMEIIDTRLKTSSFTIIDAMNISKKDIKPYLELCDKYGFVIEHKLFPIDKAEAIKRNNEREVYKRVPEFVIDKAYDKLMSAISNGDYEDIIFRDKGGEL